MLCAVCDGRGWLPDPKGRVDGWPKPCHACRGLIRLTIGAVAKLVTTKGLDEERVARAIRRLVRGKPVLPKTAREVLRRLHDARMLPVLRRPR